MKVTEVYFKRNYAISPLTMEHMHLSATVVVEEGEQASEALKLAQKTVEDFYADACSKSAPSEYEVNLPLSFVNVDKQKSTTMEDMVACEDYESLFGLRLTYKTEEEQKYYDEKIELLTKNK